MKDSHYRTPRTLADCTFQVGHARAQDAGDRGDAAIVVLSVCILCIVLPLIYLGVL